VKVTPSSKVVGDMAIYMTSNNLTEEDIMTRGETLSFPESVVSLFRGDLGQMPGGFPQDISKIILKGQKPFTDRPNAHLEPVDFEKGFEAFQKEFDEYCDELDFISYQLYPKVFKDFYGHWLTYGDVRHLPTKAFFYGLKENEEIFVQIGKGKHIIVKRLYKSKPDDNGVRKVYFELNGQTRVIEVKDQNYKVTKALNRKAESDNEIGSPLQGRLADVRVAPGQSVKDNEALFVIEAMKMETTVSAPKAGIVKKVHLSAGDMVHQEDLVIEFE
jgi:pyruvate carboxylase